jgi:recombination protein RecA
LEFWAGSVDRLAAKAASLAERRRRRQSGAGLPLSTGSLTVDHATGTGGLPRRSVIGLSGPHREAWVPLLLSAMTEVSSSGDVVGVIDSTGRISERLAALPTSLGPQLVVMKPPSLLEGLRLAARLAERGLVDLLIIDLEPVMRQAASRLSTFSGRVWELTEAAHRSTASVLLLHPSASDWRRNRHLSGTLHEAEDVQIRVQPGVESPDQVAGQALVEVALGKGVQRKTHIEIQPDLTLSREAELVELGLGEGLIKRTPGGYAYADLELGESLIQAQSSLRSFSDDRLTLEATLERVVDAQRAESARATLQEEIELEASADLRDRMGSEQLEARRMQDQEAAEEQPDLAAPEGGDAHLGGADLHEADREEQPGDEDLSASPEGYAAEDYEELREEHQVDPEQIDEQGIEPFERRGELPGPARGERAGPGPLPPPSPPIRTPRYVNTWFESDTEPTLPLIRGDPVMFGLNIGSKHEDQHAGSVAFIEPDFGNESELNLLVSFRSEDFWIDTPDHSLFLPRFGSSEVLRTRVVPLREGRCTIAIAIALPTELELLQRLETSVEVAQATLVGTPKG